MTDETDGPGARSFPKAQLSVRTLRRTGAFAAAALASMSSAALAAHDDLDAQLAIALNKVGFTGRIESKLTSAAGLGRPVDKRLADLGRKLFSTRCWPCRCA